MLGTRLDLIHSSVAFDSFDSTEGCVIVLLVSGVGLALVRLLGYLLIALITIIGVRMIYYYVSYFFHWPRYRHLPEVTSDDVMALFTIPYVKIQITTRGSAGSSEVIERGIRNVVALAREAPELYCAQLSIEIVTESAEQERLLQGDLTRLPLPLDAVAVAVPPSYETPRGTQLKARALHYMTELRRNGFNAKPGKTFIVHYDEESVMEPGELRKLIRYLATTDKQIVEGPIYYPLEYTDTSAICRAMEANRPLTCFECRQVMESGTPLHLHGSNLVIDEQLENELGWDFGVLDGQPFVAEDYVFGVLAYLRKGPEVFGWHGSVMLEQPPFSFRSAFRQRYRWILGVLQGLQMLHRLPRYQRLPRREQRRLTWPVRYRILTFALGFPTGVLALPYLLYQAGALLSGQTYPPLPLPVMLWLVLVGFLWFNSVVVGVWYNLSFAQQLSPLDRWREGLRTVALAPVAGIMETVAGFWAVYNWLRGNRVVNWRPTPKTRHADRAMHWTAR